MTRSWSSLLQQRQSAKRAAPQAIAYRSGPRFCGIDLALRAGQSFSFLLFVSKVFFELLDHGMHWEVWSPGGKGQQTQSCLIRRLTRPNCAYIKLRPVRPSREWILLGSLNKHAVKSHDLSLLFGQLGATVEEVSCVP